MRIEILPEVVVADTSPLVHLAAIGCLGLLNELGRVVIMDMVRFEATGDGDKPFAREIDAWIEEGEKPGTNRPVAVARTETGEAFRLARGVDPGFRMPNGGEIAIVEWLAGALESAAMPALVVYEDKKVPRMIATQGLEATVYTATTRAVLEMAERQGLIDSGARLWSRLTEIVPTASPENRVRAVKPA